MRIFIFDFDDTLFPTTDITDKTKHNKDISINMLSDSISNILKKASENGKIFIITNAEKDWVEYCCDNYLDCDELEKNIKNVYSTVDLGFNKNTDHSKWKIEAFDSILKEYFQDQNEHELISFGDSKYDRDAAFSIGEKYKNVFVKNIFFIHRPTIENLINEHLLVMNMFENIINKKTKLDIIIQK